MFMSQLIKDRETCSHWASDVMTLNLHICFRRLNPASSNMHLSAAAPVYHGWLAVFHWRRKQALKPPTPDLVDSMSPFMPACVSPSVMCGMVSSVFHSSANGHQHMQLARFWDEWLSSWSVEPQQIITCGCGLLCRFRWQCSSSCDWPVKRPQC